MGDGSDTAATIGESIRADLRAMEGRVRDDIGQLREDFRDYRRHHAGEHNSAAAAAASLSAELEARVDSIRLERAQEKGAIGMAGWVLGQLGANWKAIAAIAAAIGFITGELSLQPAAEAIALPGLIPGWRRQ